MLRFSTNAPLNVVAHLADYFRVDVTGIDCRADGLTTIRASDGTPDRAATLARMLYALNASGYRIHSDRRYQRRSV